MFVRGLEKDMVLIAIRRRNRIARLKGREIEM